MPLSTRKNDLLHNYTDTPGAQTMALKAPLPTGVQEMTVVYTDSQLRFYHRNRRYKGATKMTEYCH